MTDLLGQSAPTQASAGGALKLAFDNLVQALCDVEAMGGIDVYVPLYANTFPMASAAAQAIKNHAEMHKGEESRKKPQITIKHYEWAWDTGWFNDGKKNPPFKSSRPYQFFFATKGEFETIYRSGISFFAFPISVFHPRFLFISTNAQDRVSSTHDLVQRLAVDLDGTMLNCARCGNVIDDQTIVAGIGTAPWTWITDVPQQVESLSLKIGSRLGISSIERQGVRSHYWKLRDVGESLGLPEFKADGSSLKAYVWGGPLASAAQLDVRCSNHCEDRLQQPGWPRLRSMESQTAGIRMPSLTKFFEDTPTGVEELDERHTLYACVGYKEDVRVSDRYISPARYPQDTLWSLGGKLYQEFRDTDPLVKLIETIREFYFSLFETCQPLDACNPNSSCDKFNEINKDSREILTVFRRNYDEHCRTVDPISQFYSTRPYATCISHHHDMDALKKIIAYITKS